MHRMAKNRPPCGKHRTLAENDGARVSQCPCGSVHVLVKGSGVSVQLKEEPFQKLGLAIMGAVAALGSPPPLPRRSAPRDSSIN